MKLYKASELKLEKLSNNFFTGEVMRSALMPAGVSSDFMMSVVRYPKGVRNKFHIHNHDQILIGTAGEGIVATEDGRWKLREGDIICIPGGVNHWHGASENADFTHIALVRAGDELKQTEE